MAQNIFSDILERHFKMNQDYVLDLVHDLLDSEKVQNTLLFLMKTLTNTKFFPSYIINILLTVTRSYIPQ